MERIRGWVMSWTSGRGPAEIAAWAAWAIVMAVVPGALTVWIAWRLLRQRYAAQLWP